MLERKYWACPALVALFLSACSGAPGAPDADAPEKVGTATEALSACNETVPSTRYIDGFPAYAQCDATQNSEIYSNNGIDTATASMGPDWVQTQFNGGYQCTELAHRYLYFKWHVTWLPRGNAGAWCDTQPTATSGVVQTMTPVHGDIMVFPPGSCGADATTGHVAVVDVASGGNGKISAVQQNVAARSSYQPSCAKCYLHVVANDGSTTATGNGGATSTGGASGAGGAAVGSGGTPMTASGGMTSFGTGGALVSGGSTSTLPGGGGQATVTGTGTGTGGQATVTGAGGYAPPAGTGGVSTTLTAGGPANTAGASGALAPSESSSSSCAVASFATNASGSSWVALGVACLALRRRQRRIRAFR